MNLVQAFVRNPVKVTVGAILLSLFGGIALSSMPMQLVPEVQTPTITIETTWPGASPQEVERAIVQEQEEQLKGVEGVVKMSSECMDSMGKITLEFKAGEDMSSALLRVNNRLQQVREYPEQANEPVLNTANSSDQPIAWFILRPRVPEAAQIAAFQRAHPALAQALEPARSAESAGLRQRRLARVAAEHPAARELLPPEIDMPTLRRFAEDQIEARFERVAGVSNSDVLGGRKDEMQVHVDPQRLAARGVTLQDMRIALRARNRDISAGDFWDGKRRYVVRTLGQYKSPEEVASTIVAERDGATILVRDVAEVHLGFKKADGMVRNMGTTVLAVRVIRDRGANVIDVMRGLYEVRDQLNKGLLAQRGLFLDQVYDETEYIHAAVGLLQSNVLLAGLLTICVLLVFLRSGRSTAVIALAIPLSIIGTFLVLDLLGRSLNVVSLAGLAFAVGMLVDNAVVVLENIYRHYQQGSTRLKAAVDATREVWGAVLASTLTTLAVFLPILFVQEEAGQLFRDIALAISSAVGLSLIVSITLIPTMSARILPRRTGRADATVHGRNRLLDRIFGPLDVLGRGFTNGVLGAHRWLQRGVLRQVALVVLLVATAGGLAVALFPKVEYLPQGNRNLTFGVVLPPPGYNLDELVLLGETVERALEPYWEAEPGSAEEARLDAPAIRDFFFVARGRQVFLGMRARDPLRAAQLVPLVQRIGAGLPGTNLFANQSSLFERGLTGGRTIAVEIVGPELERLVALGGQVMGMARSILPEAQIRPVPSLDLSNPEVHVIPRWHQAAELGISTEELGYAVDSLVDGAYAGDYYLDGEKIDLTLVGLDRFAGRQQDLAELPLATRAGDLVPLGALADVVWASGPEQIHRRERQRSISIEVRPPDHVALEDALDLIEEGIVKPLTAQGALGGDYRINLAGTADKLSAAWKALSFNILLAVLITYLLMAALFESWLHPFVILFSVPLGAAGGFLGLWVLNHFVYQALDVLTMIGFVILIGTVVNNAILIVHQSLVHLRAEGEGLDEAVLRSVRSRMRPIFMTVTTTLFGLLPMVIRPGAGSELYRGLASVLIGGLAVSTLFTIFLVPTLFRLAMRAQTALVKTLGLGSDVEPTV